MMILMVSMLIVTIAIVSYVTYKETTQLIQSSTKNEAFNAVYEITRYSNQYFENFGDQLLLNSSNERIINYIKGINQEDEQMISSSQQPVVDSFDHFMKLNESIQLTYIGTKSKEMEVTPPVNLPEGFDPTSRPWYIDAENNPHEVVWTDPYITEDESGEVVVTAAKAVLEPETSEVIGVIGYDISLNALTAIINQVEVNYQGYTSLFDANGIALVHPTLTGEDLSENETVKQMYLGEPSGIIEYRFDDQDRFMYYSTIPETG
ncbi:cache domain-containing protein [Alkalihalobacterium sp. APHAB7]